MKISLLSDDAVRFESAGSGMTVEADDVAQSYSPFHMLASGLAYCTWSVLASWAAHADIGADDLTIEVRWAFAEKPHRVGSYTLDFTWPSLPATRHAAALRAAELCAVHATLTHPPAITITNRTAEAATPPATVAATGAAR